jgi:HSP20 family molecular chaperone IbpA
MVDKESMTLAEWSPLVDITEDDKEYLIKAELPEIKKEEIKFTVENGVLVISGERKLEKEERAESITAWSVPMAASCAASVCRMTRTPIR